MHVQIAWAKDIGGNMDGRRRCLVSRGQLRSTRLPTCAWPVTVCSDRYLDQS